MFFITGDLKDCCLYVNRRYCETSVFTVNVIWLLLLYSCFYHALQHWFQRFSVFPILLSPFLIMKEEIFADWPKKLISWTLIGRILLSQVFHYEKQHFVWEVLLLQDYHHVHVIIAGSQLLITYHNVMLTSSSNSKLYSQLL